MELLREINDNLPTGFWLVVVVLAVMIPIGPAILRLFGKEVPGANISGSMRALFGNVLIFLVMAAADPLGVPSWLRLAIPGALFAGFMFYLLWKRLTAPAPEQFVEPVENEVPTEALTGFAAAMAGLVVIMLIIMVLG